MSERTAFKDWFDAAAVEALADILAIGFVRFPRKRFVRQASTGLEGLEMMDRVRQISAAMEDALPDDLELVCGDLVRALPQPLEGDEQVTGGYLLWPVGQYLADQCRPDLSSQELAAAFRCMEELTQRFSAEFAVRPYLEQHAEPTLAFLEGRVEHESVHVRRWCSEGTRPRLPWGRKLKALEKDPSPSLRILEALRADPERYVQRSVANHLNDIAKVDPHRVVELAARWWQEESDDTRWIVRHALRHLVKQGHPGALEVLGYGPPRSLEVSFAATPQRVEIGSAALLHADVSNRHRAPQPLMIDFVVHYVKASANTSAKVFKWKQIELTPGETATLEKKLKFQHVSIRRIHPGLHRLELQVNGQVVADASIDVH